MYRFRKPGKSQLVSVDLHEGETIEMKVARIQSNNEPIKDGAPEIFTERKDGVIAAYNIRTDRFEIAAEAMDAVAGSIAAKREEKAKGPTEEKKGGDVIDMKPGDTGDKASGESGA